MGRKTKYQTIMVPGAKAEVSESKAAEKTFPDQAGAVIPKRNLRVTKWLSTTPAIAVCTACTKEFKVPLTALTKTTDAQINLQQQFDRHECAAAAVKK
jgi:hypothetical protein